MNFQLTAMQRSLTLGTPLRTVRLDQNTLTNTLLVVRQSKKLKKQPVQ